MTLWRRHLPCLGNDDALNMYLETTRKEHLLNRDDVWVGDIELRASNKKAWKIPHLRRSEHTWDDVSVRNSSTMVENGDLEYLRVLLPDLVYFLRFVSQAF